MYHGDEFTDGDTVAKTLGFSPAQGRGEFESRGRRRWNEVAAVRVKRLSWLQSLTYCNSLLAKERFLWKSLTCGANLGENISTVLSKMLNHQLDTHHPPSHYNLSWFRSDILLCFPATVLLTKNSAGHESTYQWSKRLRERNPQKYNTYTGHITPVFVSYLISKAREFLGRQSDPRTLEVATRHE